MKPELRFEEKVLKIAELGTESPLPDLLGEAVIQNQLKFNLGEKEEIYEGYGRTESSYPYRQYNSYTRDIKEKTVKTAVLENDFLKAVFLPEYGGRLWELWDKKEKRNLLYTNEIIRFGNLAVRNAWFSGGVEWNIGIIGHCPFTTDKLYTARLETEEGDPLLRMYEYERVRGITYQMDFWLGEKERFLKCRMRVVNESENMVPMYWWSNMAVPEYKKGRVIVPSDSAYTNKDGVVYKVDIPKVEGISVCDYEKIPRSVDYFFDIKKEAPKYIANIDAGGYGILQMSTERLQSRKLFSWGHRDSSERWQEFLNDENGRYVEIQAGLAKTQYGCIPMAAHAAWEWMELYGSVQLPKEIRRKGFEKNCAYLTEQIVKSGNVEALEKELKETEKLAKTEGELIFAGSGYGSITDHSFGSSHLKFVTEKESLKKWNSFFETGILHEASPEEVPDEFLMNKENVEFLKVHMEENKKNWYAWYHLGIGYYVSGKLKKAEKALEKSEKLEPSVWAYHALACVEAKKGDRKKGKAYIKKGLHLLLSLEKESEVSVPYLKEGFKILDMFGAEKEICKIYKNLPEELQKVSRLRYYYIKSLSKRGEEEKAYTLLEKNGGLILEDIREGEDSLGELWSALYEKLYEKPEEIPHIYNFKM